MGRHSERPRGRILKTYSKKHQSRRSLDTAVYRELAAGNDSEFSSGDESPTWGTPRPIGHRTPSAASQRDEDSLPETEEMTPEETHHDRVQLTKDPYHLQTSSVSPNEGSSQDDDDSLLVRNYQSHPGSSQKSSVTSVGPRAIQSAIKTEPRDSPEAFSVAMVRSNVQQLRIKIEDSPFQGRKRKRAGSPFRSELTVANQPQRFNQQEAWKDPESSKRRSLPVVFGPRTPSPITTQRGRKVANIHPQDYKVLPSTSPAAPTIQRGVRDGFERREVPKFSKHYFDGKRRRRPPPTPGIGSLLKSEKSKETIPRKVKEPGSRNAVSDPANAYLMSGAILDKPQEASRPVASPSNRNINVRPSIEQHTCHVSYLDKPADEGNLENEGAANAETDLKMKRSYAQESAWMATAGNFVLRDSGNPTTRRSTNTTSESRLYLGERDTRPAIRDTPIASEDLSLLHLTN